MADAIPEEYKELIATLQKMKIQPKADSPEDFENWIKAFAKQKEDEKQTEDVKQKEDVKPTLHSITQPPRLNYFSGSKDRKGGETSYELWRYEVQGLQKDKIHSDETIIQAIRRSVRGEAGLVCMRLGPEASLKDILMKMESVYGNVDEVETIMSDFYNARQTEDEDVATWSCRLEGILDRAIHEHKVSRTQADAMLHDMLWKGLLPALKDVSHFEKKCFTTFDTLRTALRRIEKEQKLDQPTKPKATMKKAVVTDEPESELAGILKLMNNRLEKLESEQQQINEQQCQQQQHQNFQQRPNQYQQRPTYYRDRGQSTRGRFRGRGYGRGFGRSRGAYGGQQQQTTTNYKFPVVVCNRCHREGHIAVGCRSNTDVNGKPLN